MKNCDRECILQAHTMEEAYKKSVLLVHGLMGASEHFSSNVPEYPEYNLLPLHELACDLRNWLETAYHCKDRKCEWWGKEGTVAGDRKSDDASLERVADVVRQGGGKLDDTTLERITNAIGQLSPEARVALKAVLSFLEAKTGLDEKPV